jgi:hypothetical protein
METATYHATTPDEIVTELREDLRSADIAMEAPDRNPGHPDLPGGWINGLATLSDGSRIGIGFWLDPDLAAAIPYSVTDLMYNAEPSERLVAAFARVADEDGGIEVGGEFVQDVVELLALIAADDCPGHEQAEEAWAALLREQVSVKAQSATLAELVNMLI